MTSLRLRTATAEDAEGVALLHAESWRRHYRGAYADAFLDGDLHADRRTVWSARLAAPAGSATFVAEDLAGDLAEDPAALVGFVHVVLDKDGTWGSLVDNLHVLHGRQRTGVGGALLTRAAGVIAERAAGRAMYLWVLEQNTSAQRFYRALGGTCAGVAAVSPPGGDPARLDGSPKMLRIAWPDASLLGPSAADV